MRRVSLLFLSAAVVATSGCDAFREGFAKGKDAAIDRQLGEIADQLNRTLPKMVDSTTRLDNASALPGKTLQYSYTLVDTQAGRLDAGKFEAVLKPRLLNMLKTTPEMATFRDAGVTFVYVYRDKDGVLVGHYSFGPADYNG